MKQSLIYSKEKNSYWLLLIFGLVFMSISLPALLALPRELDKNNYLVLMVLLFPLAGGWVLWLGIRAWRNWRHYGPLPVQMNPAPGQVGGDIGGSIELRIPWQMENPYQLTLQCLRSEETGTGKNRRHSESLVWQQDQVPFAEASTSGTTLCFVFTPPEHLPASEQRSRDYHLWRLLLTGPDKRPQLERSYDLPVSKGIERSTISIPARHTQRQTAEAKIRALESVDGQIELIQLGDGVRLHSPLGSHVGMKLVFLLFGLGFAGAAVFLTYQALAEGGTLWLMATVFSLVGYPLLVIGVFVLGRSLTTEVRAGQVRAVRYWCGLSLWTRQIALSQASQLSIAAGMKSNDGRQHTEYLHLEAAEQGRKVRLAENIKGREAAEALRDSLIRLLGLR